MGYKLEQFIFDAFPYSPSTALFEVNSTFPHVVLFWIAINAICNIFSNSLFNVKVLREEEFAPVKNANGANFDTPDSARLLVLRLHTRWVVAAGGFLTHSVPLYATGTYIDTLQRPSFIYRRKGYKQNWD